MLWEQQRRVLAVHIHASMDFHKSRSSDQPLARTVCNQALVTDTSHKMLCIINAGLMVQSHMAGWLATRRWATQLSSAGHL
jgi:hypothetical protein